MRVSCAGALELSVVGDFDPEELEKNVLTFIGTLPPLPPGEVRSSRHIGLARKRCWHESSCRVLARPCTQPACTRSLQGARLRALSSSL